jgi:hypothetical protein
VAGRVYERPGSPDYWIWTRQPASSEMQRSAVIRFAFETRYLGIASVVQEVSSAGNAAIGALEKSLSIS